MSLTPQAGTTTTLITGVSRKPGKIRKMTGSKKYHSGHFGLVLFALYVGAVAVYVVCEHHSLGDAMWWAFMTFTTVGYGDQYPHTLLGRLAGMLLVSTAVFVVVPAITARVVMRFTHDADEWTHEEQEEVKANLRKVLAILESKN